MLRVGIVGYGFAGRGFHAALVRRVEGLSVSAVATRSPERRAQAEADGIPASFPTLGAMLAADACDVVVIATPHDTHLALGLEALAAGKHVVLDKPMALTTAEADRLIAARDAAGVVLSVFHNRRWDWDYLTVSDVVASGAIGPVYRYETAVLRYKPPRGWRAEAEAGGGLLYDWGAHLVDQALQLVEGPLATVSAEVQYRGWGAEAGSYGRMELRFASGVLYGIEIGNMAAIGKPRWYVLGERGALVKHGLDPQEPALLAGDIGQASEKPEEKARLVTMDGLVATERVLDSIRSDWTCYYENMRDALLGRSPLAVRPEEARRVIAVLEAASASAARHVPVPVE